MVNEILISDSDEGCTETVKEIVSVADLASQHKNVNMVL